MRKLPTFSFRPSNMHQPYLSSIFFFSSFSCYKQAKLSGCNDENQAETGTYQLLFLGAVLLLLLQGKQVFCDLRKIALVEFCDGIRLLSFTSLLEHRQKVAEKIPLECWIFAPISIGKCSISYRWPGGGSGTLASFPMLMVICSGSTRAYMKAKGRMSIGSGMDDNNSKTFREPAFG